MTIRADDRDRVRTLVENALGVSVEILGVQTVTAGANKSIEVIDLRSTTDGAADSAEVPSRLVLRAEPSPEADDEGMLREAELLARAHAAGVPVPQVLAAGRPGDDYEVPYLLTTFVEGESLAPRILRGFDENGGAEDFVRELGEILAHIHAIAPPPLVAPPDDEFLGWLRRYRESGVDSAPFEFAIRWLEENRPVARIPTLLHGDFRLGNLMVDGGRVSGVLDWELAHVGDPREDLAWVSAPPWRFRGPHPVAGLGSREALLDGYREAGGSAITADELHWWEVLSTVKWGAMCLGRGREAADGADRSLEFALIGRRFAECEYDVLVQLGWDTLTTRFREARDLVHDGTGPGASGGRSADARVPPPHVVEEALTESYGTSYRGRLQRAALRMLLRESRDGGHLHAVSDASLTAAGHESERSLAGKIADTQTSAVSPAERAAVEQLVCTRLTLANPHYLPRT